MTCPTNLQFKEEYEWDIAPDIISESVMTIN